MKEGEVKIIEEEYIKTRYKDIELDEENIKNIKKSIGFNRYMLGIYIKDAATIIDNQFKITKIADKIARKIAKTISVFESDK